MSFSFSFGNPALNIWTKDVKQLWSLRFIVMCCRTINQPSDQENHIKLMIYISWNWNVKANGISTSKWNECKWDGDRSKREKNNTKWKKVFQRWLWQRIKTGSLRVAHISFSFSFSLLLASFIMHTRSFTISHTDTRRGIVLILSFSFAIDSSFHRT